MWIIPNLPAPEHPFEESNFRVYSEIQLYLNTLLAFLPLTGSGIVAAFLHDQDLSTENFIYDLNWVLCKIAVIYGNSQIE